MDKTHIKFDENGKRIPRLSTEEKRQKIEQTNLEIIQDNRAQSMAETIAHNCALIKYQDPTAYAKIKAKASPKLEKMIDARYLVLVPLIEAGLYKIDNQAIADGMQRYIRILEAGI
jgi:hypothetical protein